MTLMNSIFCFFGRKYFLRLFFDTVDAFIAKGDYCYINFYSAFIKSCLLKTNTLLY